MGICISRRAMQGTSNCNEREDLPSAKSGGVERMELINPARLFEQPRISTDIADMGMLGLLFHKRYCTKSTENGRYKKLDGTKPVEEEHKEEADREEEDGYPTFQPNSHTHVAVLPDSVENPQKKIRQSAGEEFYTNWENMSNNKPVHGPNPEELGVFQAEDYFKEEPVPSALQNRKETPKPMSGSSSGSGNRWASLCTGAAAVEVDEEHSPKKKPVRMSKMLKMLGSPSSAAGNAKNRQAKKVRIVVAADTHWMDRARKSTELRKGECSQGLGSPKNEKQEGNESDSSSDLFELDSVTTTLSSARSSLSRLSSARSSVRKSTVDEQDFISDSRLAARQSEMEEVVKNRRQVHAKCIDSAPLLSIVEENKPSRLSSWTSTSTVVAVQN